MPQHLTLAAAEESWPLVVPTQWADVTLDQFVQVYAAGTPDVAPVEILCGLPAGALERLSVHAVAQLSALLAFATDPSPVLELRPTPGLPDIGTLPYGTWLLAQQYLEGRADLPAMTHMPYLLALYRTELVHGKFDAAKVAACEAALRAAPVTENWADAAFFLASYRRSLSATPPSPTTPPSRSPKKKKPASTTSTNGSGRFSAWMRRLAAPS